MGEFWDTHDFTDYEASCPDVTDQFQINIQQESHLVVLHPQLMQEAIAAAERQGISVQTLVNLAVKDALIHPVGKQSAGGKRRKPAPRLAADPT
jgi:hypothetical protein